jgi:hypothetical protein
MDSHTFKIGDHVKTIGVLSTTHDTCGTVVNFNDWWVIVKMDVTGVSRPFMESELQHVTRIDDAGKADDSVASSLCAGSRKNDARREVNENDNSVVRSESQATIV